MLKLLERLALGIDAEPSNRRVADRGAFATPHIRIVLECPSHFESDRLSLPAAARVVVNGSDYTSHGDVAVAFRRYSAVATPTIKPAEFRSGIA